MELDWIEVVRLLGLDVMASVIALLLALDAVGTRLQRLWTTRPADERAVPMATDAGTTGLPDSGSALAAAAAGTTGRSVSDRRIPPASSPGTPAPRCA